METATLGEEELGRRMRKRTGHGRRMRRRTGESPKGEGTAIPLPRFDLQGVFSVG